MININQAELWSQIAQSAINFIVVQTVTNISQKQTVGDLKQDIKIGNDELMTALKITEEQLINQIKESKGE